jgi:hypothetical protein
MLPSRRRRFQRLSARKRPVVEQVEVDGLVELFAAGQRVLALRDDGNGLGEKIRDTCDAVERRLADIGVIPDPMLSTPPKH